MRGKGRFAPVPPYMRLAGMRNSASERSKRKEAEFRAAPFFSILLGLYRKRSGAQLLRHGLKLGAGAFSIERLEVSRSGNWPLWFLNDPGRV
jgi:hypothetical protein